MFLINKALNQRNYNTTRSVALTEYLCCINSKTLKHRQEINYMLILYYEI